MRPGLESNCRLLPLTVLFPGSYITSTMAQVPDSITTCDACVKVIPPHHSRYHCLDCPDHDICHHCHSVGAVSRNPQHTSTHSCQKLNLTSATISDPAHYWGTLRDPDGTASPMFTRLCSAIFNHFDSTVGPAHTHLLEPSKVAAEEAMGVPDAGNIILNSQNAVLKAGGTLDEGDELIAISYTSRTCALRGSPTRPCGTAHRRSRSPASARCT